MRPAFGRPSGFQPSFFRSSVLPLRPSVRPLAFRLRPVLPAFGRPFRMRSSVSVRVEKDTTQGHKEATRSQTEPRGLRETTSDEPGRGGRGGGPCLIRSLLTFRRGMGFNLVPPSPRGFVPRPSLRSVCSACRFPSACLQQNVPCVERKIFPSCFHMNVALVSPESRFRSCFKKIVTG